MSDFWELGLVTLLVALNALFAGSEIALLTLRPAQIERLRLRGGAGRALGRLSDDPNRYLATIQIGITLAGFLASAAAAVSLAEPVVPILGFLGDAADVAAIMLITLVLTFFTLVFGELAPKRIAMQYPEGWAMLVARPLNVLATAARPAVWLLSTSTNLVVRLVGGDPSRQRDEVSEEELREMVVAQASLSDIEKQVISGALEVGERSLREVLVPRHALFSLRADLPIEEALPAVLESGHARVPVWTGTTDGIVGVVRLRELVGVTGSLADVMTPIPMFPESAGVLTTLRDLQKERQQMAVVVDEHGGVEGIVTIEDLIEEIVGEIYDEYDKDVRAVIHHEDGTLELPGAFPVHDLVDLGIAAEEGSYATVAGLILDRLHRIPDVGDQVELGDWTLTVAEMSRSTITRVRAVPARAAEGAVATE